MSRNCKRVFAFKSKTITMFSTYFYQQQTSYMLKTEYKQPEEIDKTVT